MEFAENRIFRVALLIVTLIVFYLWLQNFSQDEETDSASRADATDEEVLPSSQLTESVTPSPVVRTGPGTSGPLVSETEPTDESQQGVLEVTVRPGDTLEAIANAYQTTVQQIQSANPGKTNANLRAGETLRIVGASTDAAALENPSADREDGVTVKYLVEPGDFLSTIAQEYGVSEQALRDANPTIDPDSLVVSQELTIPPKGTGLESSSIERQPGETTPYTVVEGDSLGVIAGRFGVTVEEILAANAQLSGNPSNIIIGAEILIPPSS